MGNNKKYDHEKICMNEHQADYVIKAVMEEYSNREDWIIGQPTKTQLPNGEVKVVIPLTKKENIDKNEFNIKM